MSIYPSSSVYREPNSSQFRRLNRRSVVIRALLKGRRKTKMLTRAFSRSLSSHKRMASESTSVSKRSIRYRSAVTHQPEFLEMIDKVERLKRTNTYFYMRNLESASGASVIVGGRRMIMMGSNNYLGLTTHPLVKQAAIRAIEEYGTGAGGVRILSGTYRLHEQLEERLAELKQTEASVVFVGGYLTNLAAVSTLAELGYVLINDEKNHASIIDGCKVRKARASFYRHNDMAHLEKLLLNGNRGDERFVIADGVFSMDGDIADVPAMLNLTRQYGAKTYVDDAHATGVLGTHGRGTAEYFGVEGQIDIIVGTLSKALGAVGGFVAGPRDLVVYLKHASRAFVFGSALPPSVAATALAALDVIRDEPEHLHRLHQNTRRVSEGLKDLGFEVRYNGTPILPVIVGEEDRAYRLARLLDQYGVFVNPVAYPAVKPREARIRISVNALLTDRDIGDALLAFKRAGISLGLI